MSGDTEEGGSEFYYLDANGNKQDAEMWDAMLEMDPEAELARARRNVRDAMDRGTPEATARQLYGLPEGEPL